MLTNAIYKKEFLSKKLDRFLYGHKGTCNSAGAVKKEEKINIPSSKIHYFIDQFSNFKLETN